jgi:hypothetical protein
MNRRAWIASVIGAAVAPANQWRSGTFTIAGVEGPESKSGEMLGCWGIRCCSVRSYHEFELWNITHLPTGLQIPPLGLAYAEARSFVEQLAATGDWSHITRGHEDLPRLKREIDRISERMEGLSV